RPPAHALIVAELLGSPRAPRQVRVAVVVARYNEVVTGRLLEGARQCLREKGVPEAQVDVVWVPGAFELPVAAEAAAASGRYAAIVALVAGGFGHRPEGFDRGADLAAKAIAGLPEFDRRVADAAEHWRLDRVGVVEKSILRLALAELAEGATPPRVVIDEAVKLAHWFAGAKAPAFVNGV